MKTGVILANTGTPDAPTPEALERYLRQFLMHGRIRPMPSILWRVVLERFILPSRRSESAGKYSRIWTQDGSPLEVLQGSLARKLQHRMEAAGNDVEVVSAMSFGNPSIESAVELLESQGCEKLVVIPMYPQHAYSNAGIVEDDVRELQGSHPLARTAVIVHGYWENDAYIDAIADSVRKAGFDESSGNFLVISYHSVPRADIKHGDSYDTSTYKTTQAVVERLGIGSGSYAMCYQSRFDKGRKWLDPFLGDTVREAASNPGHRKVFLVTPGFAIDCLETLYDIDMVLRRQFEEWRDGCGLNAGDESFVYVSCLNDSEAHVDVCSSVLSAML